MSFIFSLMLLVTGLGSDVGGTDGPLKLELDFTYDTLVECELELGQIKQSLEAGWYGPEILEWTLTPCTLDTIASPGFGSFEPL